MSSRTTFTIRRALRSKKMLTDEIPTQSNTTEPSLHTIHITPSVKDTKRTTNEKIPTMNDSRQPSDEPPTSPTQHTTNLVGKLLYQPPTSDTTARDGSSSPTTTSFSAPLPHLASTTPYSTALPRFGSYSISFTPANATKMASISMSFSSAIVPKTTNRMAESTLFTNLHKRKIELQNENNQKLAQHTLPTILPPTPTISPKLPRRWKKHNC